MKREKRLTRAERQAQQGGPKGPAPIVTRRGEVGAVNTLRNANLDPGTHLHCVACGKHLETVGEARERAASGLGAPLWGELVCDHGSLFHACLGCIPKARNLLAEHDRTGNPVQAASAWH